MHEPGSRLLRKLVPTGIAVSAAFDKQNVGADRIARQLPHREGECAPDLAMDQQPVLIDRDLRDAVVVPFEMQTAGRDRAFQIVQRGPRNAVARHAPVSGDPAHDAALL